MKASSIRDIATLHQTDAEDSWLFAQAILGNPVPAQSRQLTEALAEQELLEWVASISTALEGPWDPAKHPRGGFPQNRGWFSQTSGVGSAKEPPAKGPERSAKLAGNTRKTSPFLLVSDKPPKQSAQHGNSSSPPDYESDEETEPRENVKLVKDDMLVFFKLLYGDKGQKLLMAFEKAEGEVRVETPWLWGDSALHGRNAFGPPLIRIAEKLNPAEAAQNLMERLIEASGWAEVRQHLNHYGFDNIAILIDSYKQSVRQSASAVALATEMYLSGISIANEGADWVITINELSEGNYYAAIGFLPFLPASVAKTGVVLKHGKQALRISGKALQALKAVPVDLLIKLLQSTRKLARNMEKAGIIRPANTAAHHIVPAGLKKFKSAEEARTILREFTSVDNAANGVYLPSKFDKSIEAAYHGSLHTERYCDEVLKRMRNVKSHNDAVLALNQIRKELLAGTFPH